MTPHDASFSVNVNVTNPGEFFACCGLLELANRLWPGAEGWFSDDAFHVRACGTGVSVATLVARIRSVRLQSDDPSTDDKACPLRLRDDDDPSDNRLPLSIRLDWWLDEDGIGGSLKTWAGQQRVALIGRAMLSAALEGDHDTHWFRRGLVVRDPEAPSKVVEPFYFDARRFAHSLDTGFSLDAQSAETVTHPAVEILALIGLQRFRPAATEDRWRFEYRTWPTPLCAPVAAAVAGGAAPTRSRCYRFPLLFRDDQKRYKAFGFATRIGGDT
jgi:CRISPR-associated protein Csb3